MSLVFPFTSTTGVCPTERTETHCASAQQHGDPLLPDNIDTLMTQVQDDSPAMRSASQVALCRALEVLVQVCPYASTVRRGVTRCRTTAGVNVRRWRVTHT
jgi:hypothetical protein